MAPTEQFVFISCGQFSPAEKSLGKQIAELARKQTDLAPFFAEEVQSLSGLDDNILRALRDCVAFITVLHPRGTIGRPDGSTHVRASVWIEQEIAIATYIQRVENRTIPIIAFRHASVGREGVRDLLQLNPIEFTEESEVLAKLPELLKTIRNSSPDGVQLQLRSVASGRQDNHVIRRLEIYLINDTNQRITQYSCVIDLPADILKHWSQTYVIEVQSAQPGLRRFRLNEENKGALEPRDRMLLTFFDYWTECAFHAGSLSIQEQPIRATVERTIKELAMAAQSAGAY
jgi:hypothetical protein